MRLELRKGQQETPDIGQVGGSFGRLGTIYHAHDLLANQLGRRDYQDIVDDPVGREAFDASYIDEVAVFWLANLVEPMTESIRHRPDSNGDLKSLRKMSTQLFGQVGAPGRKDVDILSHA